MAAETSYDLAFHETRRTYNEMVQNMRGVLGKHFPQDELVKEEEVVMNMAKKLTIQALLNESPEQAVSPDYYLMFLGLALGKCCCMRCGIPEGSFPKSSAKFTVKGRYDPAKGGAPEHRRAKREAAEKAIEESRKKKGKEVAAPPAQQMPSRAVMPAQTQQVFMGHRDTPDRSQAGPSNPVPPSMARSMWSRSVVEGDDRMRIQRMKEEKDREDLMKISGLSLSHPSDLPVVEKYIHAKVDEKGERHRGEVQHLEHSTSANQQKKAVQSQPVPTPAPSQTQKAPMAGLLPGQKAQLMCKNNVDKQFAAGVAAASVQVSKPGPSKVQYAPKRTYSLSVPDADEEFMSRLWQEYDLGQNWSLQGELRPWEVKIVGSSGYLAFGVDFCHKHRIFEFMALKGPVKVYTRTIRNDWLVVGVTVQKMRRSSSKEHVSAQYLASLVDVYHILYTWARNVAEGSRQFLLEALEADSMQTLRARGIIKEKKEEEKSAPHESHEDVKGKGKQVAGPVKQVPEKQGHEVDGEERNKEMQVVRDYTTQVLEEVRGGALRREKLIAFVEGGCGEFKHLGEADVVEVIRDHWENGTLYKGEEKEKTEAKDFARHFTEEERKRRAISKAKKLVVDIVASETAPVVDVARSKRIVALLKVVKNWGHGDILSRDEVVAHMLNTYKSLYPGEREQEEARVFKERYSALEKGWEGKGE